MAILSRAARVHAAAACRLATRTRLAVCLTGLLLLAGACGRPAAKPDADRLFSSPRLHRLNLGIREDQRVEATLGTIIAARISEGGRHVVVLDFVAPYVKVFDGRGRFERAFLRSGPGPGEARYPGALGVSGDTAIFVADPSGRMMVFGMNGSLRREATDTRMQVLAATAGCDGEWVLYGPRYGRDASRPTWLHRVRVGDGGTMRSRDLLQDSLASDMIPSGVAYGLVSDGRRAFAWHTLGREQLLAAWGCGDPSARVAARDLAGAGRRPAVRRKANQTQMEIGPGTRARGGMAVVTGGVVVAEKVIGAPRAGDVTELTLLRDDGTRRTVSLHGSYALRDSRPGVGVLVSTSDPVPQVFLISERDLLALFAR